MVKAFEPDHEDKYNFSRLNIYIYIYIYIVVRWLSTGHPYCDDIKLSVSFF